MKKILLITLSIFIFSCSKEDTCEEKRAAINLRFDDRIEQSSDESQIAALEAEREIRLDEACN